MVWECLVANNYRHIGQLSLSPESCASTGNWSDLEFAKSAIFIAAFVFISLGYFIGLSKSSLIPARVVRFFGFWIDSHHCAFVLPEDKKIEFAALREYILANREVSVETMQRLAGKMSSFCTAVPATFNIGASWTLGKAASRGLMKNALWSKFSLMLRILVGEVLWCHQACRL